MREWPLWLIVVPPGEGVAEFVLEWWREGVVVLGLVVVGVVVVGVVVVGVVVGVVVVVVGVVVVGVVVVEPGGFAIAT